MPCEQPPAQELWTFPTADGCYGTEEQRRNCYQERVALWARHASGMYKIEVDKRANEDHCLRQLRAGGVIR